MTLVMVADDSETVVTMMRMRLELAGYEVVTAADGVEVIEALLGDDPVDPDVILLDAMMPRMSGMEALEQLREEGLKTPVVMISAHLDASEPSRAKAAGANASVPKPFDWDDLLKQIEALAK